MHTMDITPRIERDVAVFDVAGEIDLSNVDRAKEMICAGIDRGYREVILNLGRVRYMDSSGLSLMISLKKMLGSEGSVSLVDCPSVIHRMLAVTRLDAVIPVYENETDALQAARDRRRAGQAGACAAC